MIITELNGGLGNQMFQYACGRALSLAKLTNLKISTNTLKNAISSENFTARELELSIFNFHLTIADERDIKKFVPHGILQKVLNKLFYKNEFYIEPTFNYSNPILKNRANVFLKGYWQSEKYFLAAEKFIRDDFSFIAQKNSLTLDIEKKITSLNAVSIHIRRGDYITSQSANNFHGVLDISYYENAILLLSKMLDNPFYFVFTDDKEWVNSNLVKSRENMMLISHNKNKDSWQDMYLMSKCKHHIIANSSFSWWGAWLNNSKSKIVIAPKAWFKNEIQNLQTQDLIPNNWMRI
jgi:hypothetical protein